MPSEKGPEDHNHEVPVCAVDTYAVHHIYELYDSHSADTTSDVCEAPVRCEPSRRKMRGTYDMLHVLCDMTG